MKISIIIPVYNVEKYIKRCLLSVINQTYNDIIECIIVNDCTPDNSMSIIAAFIKENKKNIEFKIINHDINKGLSAARNSGIKASTGTYLYFLDSDDEIFPDAIYNLSSVAEKYHPDLVVGNTLNNSKTADWLDLSKRNYPTYSDSQTFIQTEWINIYGAWNRLIRRDFILDNKLFFKEGILHEDNRWILFSKKYVKSIAFCFIPTYNYCTNQNTIMTTMYKDNSILSYISIADEYFHKYKFKDNRGEYKDLIGHINDIKKNLLYHTRDKKRIKSKFYEFIFTNLKNNNLPIKIRFLLGYFLLPKFFIRNRITKIFLAKTH